MSAPWTVFLDRDGVFNVHRVPGVVRKKHFEWLPGVCEAMARLNSERFQTCLCTNQPMVGLLMATPRQVHRINAHVQAGVEAAGGRLDRIEAAFAPVWLKHRRRKPRPGMLHDGARWLARHGRPVDPRRSVMVGDTLKDAQAGQAFGAKTILLATTHTEDWLREQAAIHDVRVDAYCADLPAAIAKILAWADSGSSK